MGRLLDSDTVKKALCDAVDDISRGYIAVYGIEEDDIEGIIDSVPSVQPEIIHCKDCKHWREGIGFSYCDKLYGMGVQAMYDYMKTEDEYCSMAERRTDE